AIAAGGKRIRTAGPTVNLLKTNTADPKIHRVWPRLNRPSSPPGDEAPNEQDNHRAHDGSDEPGSLIGAVPADCLPQIGRDKGSGYSEQRCQNKSGRLVVSGRDEFRDHARDKSDDDCPNDV